MRFKLRVRAAIKELLHRWGFDVVRYIGSPGQRKHQLIEEHGIKLVIDVGANIGQFGEALRSAGYDGHILSFEPMCAEFNQLVQVSSKDPRWTTENVALSDVDGYAVMQVAGNSASSSLREMSDVHEAAAPDSVVVGTEEVRTQRLDAELSSDLIPGPWMLKIDVQGFEIEVLEGAKGILSEVEVVELELSMVELYHGAPTVLTVLHFMDDLGFQLFDLESGFSDPADGRVLQYDGLFVRKNQ